MIPATVMEARTATGAATSTGMMRASRGTATRASPNPNADRKNVATKKIVATWTGTQSAIVTPLGVCPGRLVRHGAGRRAERAPASVRHPAPVEPHGHPPRQLHDRHR